MYFAGLSTNFCHSMVAISAFAEKLWSTYTRFFWWWRQDVSRIINQILLWLWLGRKVDRKKLRIHSNIVRCLCLQKNRGMLPSIELLVFLLNELDVIVIVINGRTSIESWNTDVFSTTILLLYFEDFLSLLLFFRFVVE